MEKLCTKHPRYQGKKAPTTKLGPEDGCTCHEAYQKILAETTSQIIVEKYSMFGPSKEWKMSVPSKDPKEIAKKVFRNERPGIGTILKIYLDLPEGRKYLCTVGAQVRVDIKVRGNDTHKKITALSTHFTRRRENLSPSDIYGDI